jgi:hypothetical protein
MRTNILAAALALGVLGCAGGYSAQVTATTPELVLIEPGIQVVVDSDVPVFYTDSFYWRYENDVWYRSQYATGGWIRIDVIPPHLRRIDRPHQYARYHPPGRTPVVRDHRTPAPPPVVRDHRTPPPPVVRDHRDDKDKDKGKGKKDKDKKPG